MFLLKLFKMAFALLITLVLLVAIAQLCAFYLLADDSKSLHNADHIVLFPGGGKEREIKAWILAQQSLAPNLIIVNSTANLLKNKAEKYEGLAQLQLLEGGKSRSTFEDTYVAVQRIEQHNFNSVILITSSYHMPRFLFLLKMHLIGLGLEVDVQYMPVPLEDRGPFAARMGLYYNEMIKIWGSFLEIAGHHLTRKLMYDAPHIQEISKFVHKYLIYNP